MSTSTPAVPPRVSDVQPLLAYCGRILRQAREQQGLTLDDVAARTHTAKTRIADFETNIRDLSLGRILRLAQVLGVAFADLLPPEGPSALGKIALLLHARGPTFCERQLALLEVPPDCLSRHQL